MIMQKAIAELAEPLPARERENFNHSFRSNAEMGATGKQGAEHLSVDKTYTRRCVVSHRDQWAFGSQPTMWYRPTAYTPVRTRVNQPHAMAISKVPSKVHVQSICATANPFHLAFQLGRAQQLVV